MIASRRPSSTFSAALFRAVVGCAALTGSIHSSARTTNAEAASPALTIRGEAISSEDVKRAVAQCRANAAELKTVACLDRYWVPRWLLDFEARDQKLAGSEVLLQERKDILATRLLENIAEQTPEPSAPEIDSYLKKHERDFVKPLRIRIFRILVSTEEKAREVLGKLSAKTSISDFRKLARDHSIDRATNERGGDLGFVWPDGSTDVPQVSADPFLYAAALNIVDGEFSKTPIQEGQHFAVIWRRGTLPAQGVEESKRSLVRLRLLEEQAGRQVASLLEDLAKSVVGRNDDLLGKLRRPEATLFREP